MSKGWINWRAVHGDAERMTPEAAELVKENARLRAKIRKIATGLDPRDDKHLQERRTSETFHEGGCKLSPGEIAILHRMQAEGEL